MVKLPSKRPGPVGGKRDKNRAKRATSLRDAALSLFLERGLEVVTIEEITKRAGVAKGTYYRYFDSKAALVASLLEPVVALAEDAFGRLDTTLHETNSTEELTAAYALLGVSFAALFAGHAGVARLYLQERRGPASENRAPIIRLATLLDETVETLSAVAIERGLLRPFPAAVSSQAVIGAVEQLLFAALSGREVGEPIEVARQLVSLVMDGLVVRG